MHPVKASTAEIISLAQRLPKGRIFDSGKLFTPLIQTKVYDELMTHLPENARGRVLVSARLPRSRSASRYGRLQPTLPPPHQANLRSAVSRHLCQ